MKGVLISGINGFVGTNLSTYLQQHGYDLTGLTQREGKTQAFVKWDNIESLKDEMFTSYIHLAGKAHDLKNTSKPQEYFDINTTLTQKLFDVFLQSTARDFIFFSSVKAAADTVDDVLYEDTLSKPQTVYGQSKHQAEEYILMKKLPAGKRIFILRPCMIHGPGNKGNLNLLYSFVQKGLPYPLAAFDNKRSFLSVSNLNFVVLQILKDASIKGGVYNLADDEPLSTNAVIKLIAEVCERKPKLWKIGTKLIKGLAAAGDKLHLPLNSERLKKLTESYVVSNKKIREALNLQALPTSSTDGLKITINSFDKISN